MHHGSTASDSIAARETRITSVSAQDLAAADDPEAFFDRRTGIPSLMRQGRSLLFRLLAFGGLCLFALLVLVPFGYMALMSLKQPMEFGTGRLMPEGLSTLLQPRAEPTVMFRGRLSAEGAAALGDPETAGAMVDPSAGATRPGLDATRGRMISIEKAGLADEDFGILVEARDPHGALARVGATGTAATLLIPDDGFWITSSLRLEPNATKSLLALLLANYRTLLKWDELVSGRILAWISTGYPRWFLNSLLVAGVAVVLGVFLDSLAAFSFAKYRFPGRGILFAMLLGTLMVPYPVTLVPTFFIYAHLGLYNTYAALIIPGMATAFGIFLVKQYMQGIPDELLDAGRVDGASEFTLYSAVVVPLAAPVLAALCVFRFIFQWNSYLFPLVFTNSDSMKTLQLGLATMEDPHGAVDYGLLMAGATVAVLPVVLVYALMQRHFISGITMGGVKG
jgi:multiple sugar transport system permease protein